jgi:hypothetical protein
MAVEFRTLLGDGVSLKEDIADCGDVLLYLGTRSDLAMQSNLA